MLRRNHQKTKAKSEDEQLNKFLDDLWPREPRIRIYRIDEHTKKQTPLGSAHIDGFELEQLRERFGGGCFLLRTIRSNGSWGPSRVVHVAGSRNVRSEVREDEPDII